MRIDPSALSRLETTRRAVPDDTGRTGGSEREAPLSFDKLLSDSQKSLSFSKHAAKRLDERDIALSDDEMSRLGTAVETAGAKGMRNSLILMNDKAFIINVASGTVVTVMNGGEASEQKYFTNIDGAVIL